MVQAISPRLGHITAALTANFLRNLSASVVVASTLIFEIWMQRQDWELIVKLDSEVIGADAAANVELIIDALPPDQRIYLRE